MRIRTKLGLSFLVTVVFLTGMLSYVAISKTLDKSNREFVYHAQQKMSLVDGIYDEFFDSVANDIKYLSRNELLRQIDTPLSNYMSNIARPTDAQSAGGVEARIEAYFEDFVSTRPHLRNIYFGTADGGFVILSDDVVAEYDPRKRPWYKAARATPGVPAITSAYLSPTNEALISVAITVNDDEGALLGVLSVDVTLHQLTELVQSVRLGRTGYMLLIDDSGTVLCDPNNERNLFRNIADIDDPLFAALNSSPLVSFEAEHEGEMLQVSTYESERSGWRLVTVIENREIKGRQGPMIESILSVAALMAVVFVGFGIVIAKQISSPIRHITDSLRKIAEGDADLTQDLDIRSADEIGELAMWFNRFLESARTNQGELLRAHKLEAIGQLATGIAHEINTPTQYVSDNIAFLVESFDDLTPMLNSYGDLVAAADDAGLSEVQIARFRKIAEEADLSYLVDEIPAALSQSKHGLEHVKKIVRAMKNFSHPGTDKQRVDLNLAIESTVTVARNEWRFYADVQLNLDSKLPPVTCVPSELNQVLLNVIVNAAHAISEVVGEEGEKGTISISTSQRDGFAIILISDTGCGMSPDVQSRVFDQFYTTKEVGKGTGQGLAMAYDLIVRKHRGTIDVQSEPGAGTTFTIRLPLEASEDGAEALQSAGADAA